MDHKNTKRVNKTMSGGFLGFGSKKKKRSSFSKKDAKRKLKDVIRETYNKILDHRVNEQIKKNQTIYKYTEDISKMDENLKSLVVQIQSKSNKKTDIYKSYKVKNKWSKLVTSDEQKKVGEIAYKQMEEYKERYTDTSMSVDNLANKLVYNIIGKEGQRSYGSRLFSK
jgi:hypothetical protein